MHSAVLLAFVLVLLFVASPALGVVDPPRVPLSTFQWDIWTFEVSPQATLNRQYVSFDGLAEIEVLTRQAQAEEARRRQQYGVEPNTWNLIYALCPESDMVFVDQDGTRYRHLGGMGTSELAWARESLRQFCDAAYAYSRGNVRIAPLERVMAEPMLGEYEVTTFFWAHDASDLGSGLDMRRFDTIKAHFFPGQVRPWSHGAAGGLEDDWARHLGISRAQLTRERETGKPFTLTAIVTLHEWLHLIDRMRGNGCGYMGLPSQYSPGNVHDGSHLYWMRHILTPRLLRSMRFQGPPLSPPNKPNDRFAGFIDRWLVAGPFELPPTARSNAAMIPSPQALDIEFVDPTEVRPAADAPAADGHRWQPVAREWTSNIWRTNPVNLRQVLPSAQRDAVAYAHVYVHSAARRDAILWLGSPEPFVAWLNGQPVLKCWRGVTEDEAQRRVTLLPGWNRLLVKKLDQEAADWWLWARFTDLERTPLTDLEFTTETPAADVVATADAVSPAPVTVLHHRWRDVEDDWFGLLPILNEQELEVLFGQPGVRLIAPPERWAARELPWYAERRWLLVDVSTLRGIQSRVVPPDAALATYATDTQLNNVLNMFQERSAGRVYEGMALIRYTRSDGSAGDLVLVRPDLVELFIAQGRYPAGWTGPRHEERVLGFICRDTQTYVCFDTNVGDPLPANELDMLAARTDGLELTAGPDVAVALRGRPCNVRVTLARPGTPTGAAPPAGTVVIREEPDGATLLEQPVTLGDEPVTLTLPLDTQSRPAGPLNLRVTARCGAANEERTLDKLVCVPIMDAVTLQTRVRGSELLQTPAQTLVVTVTNNLSEAVTGTVAPTLPAGWTCTPPTRPFRLERLNEAVTFEFAVTVAADTPDGALTLGSVARFEDTGVPAAADHVPAFKRFDPVLLAADFEDCIDGDFGITSSGLYDVQLCRDYPAVGKACLQISDRGGQRFGHIYAFGAHAFRPPEIVPPDTQYTYDTRVYPFVEFWFRMMPEAADDNIALHVELDDGEEGYGVLINGKWDQQWGVQVLLGKVPDFVADGRWHHIVINLDELLDAYLGDTSHHVTKLYLGDTRKFASGWFSNYDRHRHYLDAFRIYRADAAPPAHVERTADGLPRLSLTNRVPPFESATTGGLKATLRLDALGYFPWQEPELQLWLTNRGADSLRIATHDRTRRWQVRLTTPDGTAVTRDWVSAWWDPERTTVEQDGARVPRPPAEAGQPHRPEHFLMLQAGQSHRERELRLQALLGDWAERHGVRLEPGQTYLLTARYVNDAAGAEFGPAAWTGAVETNTVRLVLYPVPTPAEEREALRSASSWRRRAQAAAQLGRAKHTAAIADLATALAGDRADDVRLNAAWALGEMGRWSADDAAAALAPAVTALLKALDDPNWRVAEYAGAALGKLGDPRATAALVARLDDESKWVRRRTLDALKELGDPTAIPAIAARLDDASREVRKPAIEALIAFCDAQARTAGEAGAPAAARDTFAQTYALATRALRDEFHMVRRYWIEALPRYAAHVDVFDALAGALDDDTDHNRAAALRGLRTLKSAAEQQGALDAFRTRCAPLTPRVDELLRDYYTGVREAAVEAYEDVTGRALDVATGHDADHWRRLFPRPGERRPGAPLP